NRGQADSQFQFLARTPGVGVYLSRGAATLGLDNFDRPAVVEARFAGANPQPEAVTEEPLSGRVNYFFGNVPDKWITDISTYRRVVYRNIYPGIDVAYYGAGGKLEHDMIVHPGADPTVIRLQFRGADHVAIGDKGAATVHVKGRSVEWKKPVLYQE